MSTATRLLLEALIRHAKGILDAFEKWVKVQGAPPMPP